MASSVCASVAWTLLAAPHLLRGTGPSPAELTVSAALAAATLVTGLLAVRAGRAAAATTQDVLPRASVAALAHEVRTPLTAAVGHLDLVSASPELDAGHRRGVESTLGSLERATALLSDFLADPAAWQPGGHLRDSRPVDLDEVVRHSLVDFAPLAARRHLSIAYDSAGPRPLVGDGRALRQAVDNLLSNAVKYTEAHGWVDVRLRQVAGDRGPWAELEVTNPGTTLDCGEAALAFEPDFRGRGAAARAEGHGVGLAVVRRVAGAHGGEATLASSPETGTTTARITLPCAVD